MKDAAKLRAVVDAIAEGGVRAIEVTMTVPGAVGLIAQAGAVAAVRHPARRRHGDRCGDGARGDRRRRAVHRQPGVPPRGHRRCHERGMAVAPGCFTPTEILDAHDAGADVVKVFPATALGPQLHQGRPRAAAAGAPDADRRRDARQRRRLDPRRRGGGRRRIRAARHAGDRRGTARRAHRQRAAHRRQRRLRQVVSHHARTASSRSARSCCASARPASSGCFQSPVLSATFGGGEANVAVSLAQFGLESHYVTRLPAHAIGDAAVRALRAEGVDTRHVVARRQPRRHLLRRDRRQPARLHRHLRPRPFGDQRDPAPTRWTGTR